MKGSFGLEVGSPEWIKMMEDMARPPKTDEKNPFLEVWVKGENGSAQ